MTSESSSAVLALNDDTEDTEAASITDDAKEGPPLIMEHGYDIAVKVDAPMKQLSTLETFVSYRVRCVCARWATPAAVRRRYNHFKLVHKRLSSSHPWLAPPPLPPLHTAREQLDRYSATFVATRTMALDAFLDRVAKHPIFTHNEDFRLFVTTPDEDFDKVFKSENSAMNLWGLSAALYGGNENKPANGARVKEPEWTAHADYLSSLQHKLTTLCTLTDKLHKGTSSLAHEMTNMKRTMDAWSSQAGGAAGRAAGAVGAAAGGASCLPRAQPRYRAVLPLLASYTAAHEEKIRQRDALHAAYVAGGSVTADVHNKLSQASEALRSELGDWLPKTKSEVKSLLLELANRQVGIHTQVLSSWERALSLSNDNISDMFKTVSKMAVRHLSPSKCVSLTETDLQEYSTDEEGTHSVQGDPLGSVHGECRDALVQGDPSSSGRGVSIDALVYDSTETNKKTNEVQGEPDASVHSYLIDAMVQGESMGRGSDLQSDSTQERVQGDPLKINDMTQEDSVQGDPLKRSDVDHISIVNATEQSEPMQNLKQDALRIHGEEEFLNDILDDANVIQNGVKQNVRSDVVSDPLRDFSDVDLTR